MVQSDHTPKMGNFLFVARTHTLDIRQSKSTTITKKTSNTNFIKIPSEMHGICLKFMDFSIKKTKKQNVTIKNLQSRSTQTN